MRYSHLSSNTVERLSARLGRTSVFGAAGLQRWIGTCIAVIGAGTLGAPLATAIVMSGGMVGVFDFDIGAAENLGNQVFDIGTHKARSVVAACQTIMPGRARAFCRDVRHVGIGTFQAFDILIDATDDPNLGLFLTEISNGLGVPLLRCAVDGSGERELGRVLCSSAATGHACQVCPHDLHSLIAGRPRTGCPGPQVSPAPRPPTLAGGPTSMTIAGLGVLSAQRLSTGIDAHLVYGRENIVDWTGMQMFSLELPRSRRCLSGHVRWAPQRVDASADSLTLADLLVLSAERFGEGAAVTLEPYQHPLNLQASCDCGAVADAIGTMWSKPPACYDCGRPMTWLGSIQLDRLSRDMADQLGILDKGLFELGFPDQAMFVVRAPNKSPSRLILSAADSQIQEDSP